MHLELVVAGLDVARADELTCVDELHAVIDGGEGDLRGRRNAAVADLGEVDHALTLLGDLREEEVDDGALDGGGVVDELDEACIEELLGVLDGEAAGDDKIGCSARRKVRCIHLGIAEVRDALEGALARSLCALKLEEGIEIHVAKAGRDVDGESIHIGLVEMSVAFGRGDAAAFDDVVDRRHGDAGRLNGVA
jgi:hypothetical protein